MSKNFYSTVYQSYVLVSLTMILRVWLVKNISLRGAMSGAIFEISLQPLLRPPDPMTYQSLQLRKVGTLLTTLDLPYQKAELRHFMNPCQIEHFLLGSTTTKAHEHTKVVFMMGYSYVCNDGMIGPNFYINTQCYSSTHNFCLKKVNPILQFNTKSTKSCS